MSTPFRPTLLRSCLLCCGLLAAFSASAAEDMAHLGIFLDGSPARLDGPSFDVGLRTNNDLTFTGGSVVGLDPGTNLVGRFTIVFHAPGDNRISLGWRRYDESFDRDASSSAGFFTTLTSPGVGIDFANQIASKAEVRMDTVDLQWRRRFASGERTDWWWQGGLRWVRYRSDWATNYDAGTDLVAIHDESDGIGLMAGLSGEFRLARGWMLRGAVRGGLLTGSTDSDYREAAPGGTAAILRDGQDRTFECHELEGRVVWQPGGGFELSAGWEFSRTTNLITRDRIADDLVRGDIVSSQQDVNFSGAVFGAGYTF